jgi:hypothetical protein
MSYPPTDPNGYYQALGLALGASPDDIKSAYRIRAKQVHPDHNTSADAKLEFQRIVEAYGYLRDPKRKAVYDDLCENRVLPAVSHGHNSAVSALAPIACSRCGRITAQPRYIVFQQVRSYFLTSRRSAIEGIFCRDCADRTAIQASSVTWRCGWWSPIGPFLSIFALLVNLLGGMKPRADNARLLLHQANAFLRRGDRDVARSLALQARPYAREPAYANQIASLLRTVEGSGRSLHNRWHDLGTAFAVQLLPLLALPILLASLVLLLTSVGSPAAPPREPAATADIAARAAVEGEIRHVAVDLLKLRQKPGPQEPVLALLDRFTTVQVIEKVGDTEWVMIQTPTGSSGYVPVRSLFAGSGAEPRQRWCAEQSGSLPESGAVLLRRTSGEHRLRVVNNLRRDAVVKLKALSTNSTLLSFFIPSGADVSIASVPEGAFRVIYAFGERYSRGCGIFLKNMETLVVPTALTIRPASGRGAGRLIVPELTLAPAGPQPTAPRPVAAEAYLRDD